MERIPGDAEGKFARAQLHLAEIRGIIETWQKQTTHTTISEPDPDASGMVHCERYVARITGPLLPGLSVLLGDCVHNFKSVLDHVIWRASVVHSDGTPTNPRRVGFPHWDTRDTYSAKGLHAVSDEVKAIVEALQPYHAGQNARSHPLWVVCELDNIDKHRAVHAVNHWAKLPEMTIQSSVTDSWCEIMEPGPIEDGTVIARVHSPRALTRNEVTVNLIYQHGVVIEETETTPMLHLGQTLDAIGKAVHDAARDIMTIITAEFIANNS